MIGIELEVAAAATRILNSRGHCELRYDTAQFEPYSSAQRPDLVFSLDSDPYDIFFTELRMPLNATQILPSAEVLEERRRFIASEHSKNFRFALAADRAVDQNYRQALSARSIELFAEIESGSDLASRVLSWSTVIRGGEIQHRLKKSLQLEMVGAATVALPLAARAQESPISTRTMVPPRTAISFPTNDEAFTGVFGRLALTSKGAIWRDNLIAFFHENDLGNLGRNLEFLRFLKRTVDIHKYSSPKTFSRSNLTEWYREFQRDKEIGSKL
jgi:hypothetical protein